MRKPILIVIMLMAITAVSAAEISIESVDKTATIEEPAEYKINIENNQEQPETFRIGSIRSPEGIFSHNRSITIQPGEKDHFLLSVRSEEETVRGNYRFNVYVRSSQESLGSVTDYFRAQSNRDIRLNNLDTSTDNINPGENLELSVETINIAPRTTEYTVKSNLGDKEKSKNDILATGSQRTHNFNIEIPEDTRPGEKQLEIKAETQGEEHDSLTQSININSLEDLEIETDVSENAIYSTRQTKVTNTGNTDIETRINHTIPRYLEPLTSFKTPYQDVETEDGKNTYFWDLSLEPGQEDEIQYTVRYWPPILIIATVVSLIAVLKKIRKPIKIVKSVKKSENGLKILIDLENKSGKTIKDLKVEDFVPDIAKLEKDFPMGKPETRKTKEGTKIKWELGKMEPGETRVLEYKIKPKIEVEDGILLPKAILKQKDEKIRETHKTQTEFKP